jgi:hypothetical protein
MRSRSFLLTGEISHPDTDTQEREATACVRDTSMGKVILAHACLYAQSGVQPLALSSS